MLILTKSERRKRLADWFLCKCHKNKHDIIRALKNSSPGRWSAIEKAVNSENTGQQGGYLVPPELQVGIDAEIREESFFHKYAWLRKMNSHDLDCPSADPASAASGGSPLFGGFIGYWLAGDSVAPTQGNPVFANMTLVAKDLGGFGPVSNQMLDDGGEALGEYLEQVIGKAMAGYINYACFNGPGLASPVGLVNQPGAAVVARATAGTLAAADADTVMAKLLPACLKQSWWACSPAAFAKLSGFPGFFPAVVVNESENGVNVLVSGLYRGLPVYVTENLPTLGTKGDLILFDPKMCVLGERQEIEIAWSNESTTYYNANQSVFRAWWRGDFNMLWKTTGTIANSASGVSTTVVLNT